MFESFKDFLDSLAPQREADPAALERQLRLAVAVLLAEVMRDEDGVTPAERDAATAALRRHFGLEEAQLQELLQVAEKTVRGANDFFQFTSVLNERFSREQRIQVIEEMWRVAYADGHLGALENSVIARVADLLHVTHGEYIAAKMRVKEEGAL
jgi:uncharacterized tellurite resistance protein B-like protein